MSDFNALLAEYTEKGNAKVHGAIMICVDHNGTEIYNKVSGYDSLSPDASPLRDDAVLKVASASKLITSIALLQCVERGLVGIDEPLTTILPELDGKVILTGQSESGLTAQPSKEKITSRHLLTHTSGLGYPFTHPLLAKYAQTPEGQLHKDSKIVAQRFNRPLVFEPGSGWWYGSSLEWAGVAVRRLHGGMSLEDYMIENIWKAVGLSAPYPTFSISSHPEYKARLMQGAERAPDGGLQPYEFWQGDNPVDQEGGIGLVATAKDWVAVLADLISDAPKLLKRETIDMMFTPQLAPGSPSVAMLMQLRPAWDVVAGPVLAPEETVNHGLGGLLILGDAPEISQPKNLLAWGGASNIVWFASRDSGVAGFFGTQISPFGDPAAKELINAWKKDFWLQLYAGRQHGEI